MKIDRDELKRLYLEENKSMQTIAEETGWNYHEIYGILDEMKIKRTRSEALLLRWQNQTYRDSVILRCHNEKIKMDMKLIKKMYLEEELSAYQIADYFDVSHATIRNRLQKMGCMRSYSESQSIRMEKAWQDPKYAEYMHQRGFNGGFGFGYRGNAKDGHYCMSLHELYFDNFLYDNGIEHASQVLLPNSRRTADFLVYGTYIEIDGMCREDNYWDEKYDGITNYIVINPYENMEEQFYSLMGVLSGG